jgi:hypothetical protein
MVTRPKKSQIRSGWTVDLFSPLIIQQSTGRQQPLR